MSPRPVRSMTVVASIALSAVALTACGGQGFTEHAANGDPTAPVTVTASVAPTPSVPATTPPVYLPPPSIPSTPTGPQLAPDPGRPQGGKGGYKGGGAGTKPGNQAGSKGGSKGGGAASNPVPADVAGSATGSVRVIKDVTDGIDVPWGMAELPDGTVLVTSRDDFHLYRLVPATGKRNDLGVIPGVSSNVSSGGEGGLLGVAVAPTFSIDHRIYLYWSTTGDNRIGYVTIKSHQLTKPTTIVTGIPHNVHHNGGRLAFGPDGYLYATTGEAEEPSRAQNKDDLGGKILRMNTDGTPAPGNPFGNLVYSYGHRNVQGLAWDAQGKLFASEFGDHDYDELNWIRPGHNYGWPQSQGDTSIPGLTGPVVEFGTESDSPSGIAYADGAVWMAALQGERLYRIPLDGATSVADPQSFLDGTYGRLRSVLALDDHTLLVSTSNRDGRTSPRAGDDRILMLHVS